MKMLKWLAGGAAVALAALAWHWWATPDGNAVATQPSPAVAAPLSSTARPQGNLAPRPPHSPSAPKPETRSREQVQRDEMARLDQAFRQQAVNREWASRQEEVILDAIVGHPNDGFGEIEPDRVEIDCRSSMCRMRLDFSDEVEAGHMQQKLGLGLRGDVSAARTFYLPRPDGGLDMILYAGPDLARLL